MSYDFQNRAGNKGAGIAGAQESNVDRRERLRKLAMETIDINKDPYILRNHLGSLECRLCLTLHTNEGSYLAHTQGKKHQTNLARRAAREAKQHAAWEATQQQRLLITGGKPFGDDVPKKKFVKIGRPGYKITKVREPVVVTEVADGPHANGADGDGNQGGEAKRAAVRDAHDRGGRMGLLFQIQLPEIKEGVKPMHRFMGSFEQRVEEHNRAWQYLVVAAEPYETIAFKLQSREVDRSSDSELVLSALPGTAPRHEPGTWSHWDPDVKTYTVQVLFKG